MTALRHVPWPTPTSHAGVETVMGGQKRIMKGIRGAILAAVAGVVLVAGTFAGADEAYAAKKKKDDKSNTVTMIFKGSVKRHESCEGKLIAFVHYKVQSSSKGSKNGTVSADVDEDGHWEIKVEKVARGEFTATPFIVGHPNQAIITSDSRSGSTKSSKKYDIDFEYLRIDGCD